MTSEELIEKSLVLPDLELAIAYAILFSGRMGKYPNKFKAEEMRSILSSGTMPAVAFNRWVDLVNYLTETVAGNAVKTNLTLDEAKAAYMSGKKIRHDSFVGNEHVFRDPLGCMMDENGFCLNTTEFWACRSIFTQFQTGWEIID